MKKNYIYSILFLAAIIVFLSCKKDAPVPANPFDDPSLKAPAPVQSGYNPSPTSFDYLYQNVFKATCANSGCHDGTFEPDFRTLTSAYNTLVYAPIIDNPDPNTYSYRVTPGNSNASMIKHRLTQIPGAGIGTLGQGRMPWNDTMWKFSSTNATYINNIIAWIDGGAKDIFGNTPPLGNKNPNTLGFEVCNTGNNAAINRAGNYINISKTTGLLDFWFYVTDDSTLPQNMVSAEVKISTNRYDFSAAVTQTLTYVPNGNTYPDITQSVPPNNVQHNFKLTGFDLHTVTPILNDGTYFFIRTYIRDTDPSHTVPVETPNNGSMYYSDFFVIKMTP